MIKFLAKVLHGIQAIFTAIVYIYKYGVHGAYGKTHDDYKKILQIYNKARMEYFNQTGKSWKP
jgi:hypothetical protein